MKRTTLLCVMTLLFSAAVCADDIKTVDNGVLAQEPEVADALLASELIVSEDDGMTALRRGVKPLAVSDGFYYAKPTGMMHYIVRSMGGAASGCPESHLWTPPFVDITFENMSDNPLQTQWSTSNAAVHLGTSMNIDDKGNCTVEALEPGYGCSIPYLFNSTGTDYYSMAYCDNVSWSKGMYTSYIHCSGANNRLELNGWCDNKTGGTYASNNTGYMYGPQTRTGSFTVYDAGHYLDPDYRFTMPEATFPMDYVTQDCFAPQMPLYVENIQCDGISFYNFNGGDTSDTTYDPLRNGAVLTIEIFDQATDELLHTLTATTGDWKVSLMGGNYPDIGDFKYGTVTFTKKENGEAVPFVIDCATTLKLSGFYNEDVDVGFCGDLFGDYILDPGMGEAYMHYIDPSGEYEISTRAHFTNPRVVRMYPYGIIDKVLIAEGYGDIVIDENGENCTNVGANNFGGVQIETNLTWYDSDNNPNYSLVGVPDWITNINVEDVTSSLTDGISQNFYKISFEGEKNLGDDRYATLYVQCKGYVDDTPITIRQLSEETSGINSVTTSPEEKNCAVYNLAGQQVSDTAKGIIIKDGKKILK